MYIVNFAICDDNSAFLDILQTAIMQHCAYRDWVCHISRFTSPAQLLEAELSSVQAVFLDIDMPERNGIDLARQLRAGYPDLLLVFVTGYIQYAPKGYCVNAFRYLLKNQLADELAPCLDDVWERLYVAQESIQIQQPEQLAHFRISDLVYFEGTPLRRVMLHTASPNAPKQECMGRLSEYEAQLADKGFLRIQKSYLVNMAHIVKIKSYTATLDTGEKLAVSERSYQQVCQRFTLWKGQRV